MQDNDEATRIAELGNRVRLALNLAEYGGIDGSHHKMWVIDRMVRALISGTEEETPEYRTWVAEYEQDGEYEWDTGIAP